MKNYPTVAEVKEAQRKYEKYKKDCITCKQIKEDYRGFGPSHNGSINCSSGSIASGGRRAHCACDTCF